MVETVKIPTEDSAVIIVMSKSRNYRLNRNGNSANFFLYVRNSKQIKELFASTLNGITASVRYVSSIIVVLNAKFARLLAAHADKKR